MHIGAKTVTNYHKCGFGRFFFLKFWAPKGYTVLVIENDLRPISVSVWCRPFLLIAQWSEKIFGTLSMDLMVLCQSDSFFNQFDKNMMTGKNQPIFSEFVFTEEYKKDQLFFLLTYSDNFDFLCTLLVKMDQIFDLQF